MFPNHVFYSKIFLKAFSYYGQMDFMSTAFDSTKNQYTSYHNRYLDSFRTRNTEHTNRIQHSKLFFYYTRFEQNQEQKFKLFISLVEFALDIVALCFCHLRGCNLFHSIGFKYFWRMKKKFHFYCICINMFYPWLNSPNQAIVFGIFIQGYYNYYSRCPG